MHIAHARTLAQTGSRPRIPWCIRAETCSRDTPMLSDCFIAVSLTEHIRLVCSNRSSLVHRSQCMAANPPQWWMWRWHVPRIWLGLLLLLVYYEFKNIIIVRAVVLQHSLISSRQRSPLICSQFIISDEGKRHLKGKGNVFTALSVLSVRDSWVC